MSTLMDTIYENPPIKEKGFTYSKEDGYHSLKSSGPHNILGSLRDAITTLKDDPGGYKKKALVGAAGTVGSTALLAYLASKGVLTPHDDNGSKLIAPLIGLATLSSYYTARNVDRPERAILGGVVNAGATKALMDRVPEDTATSLPITAGSIGLSVSVPYMLNNLQLADDQAKLQAIASDPKLSENQRVMEINRIREGKDLLTRYPMLRVAPYSEKLRALYNRVHTPSSDVKGARDFIRSKVR